MKKLLTIALLLVGMTASAQGWHVSHRAADPLTGQTEADVYIFSAKGIGSLVVWDWNRPSFRVISENKMFSSYVSHTGSYVPLLVGIYNGRGEMTDRFRFEMYIEQNHSNMYISTSDFSYPSTRKKIKKVLKALRSGNGYVRFWAERWNHDDLDMKVPPFQ